jgi:hypothetical protein
MFYQEEAIKKELTCSYCKKIFKDPKIIQCGSSLCHGCIQVLINKRLKGFDCPLCNEFHKIPENGFIKNLHLANLIKQQPADVYRGTIGEDMKSMLKEIRNNTDKLINNKKNSIQTIRKHCDDVRNQVDLRTEMVIEEIKTYREELIKQVNEYEKECIEKFELENGNKSELDTRINELNAFHSKWSEYLKKSKISDNELKKGKTEADEFVSKAKVGIKELEFKMFNEKCIDFVINPNEIDTRLLGFIKYWGIKSDFETQQATLKKTLVDTNKLGTKVRTMVKMKCSFDGNFYLAYSDESFNEIYIAKINRNGGVEREKRISISKDSHSYNYFSVNVESFNFTLSNDYTFLFFSLYEKSGMNFYLHRLTKTLDGSKVLNISHNIFLLKYYKEKLFAFSIKNEIFLIFVYNVDLSYNERFGQNDPLKPFYFPQTISNFEINDDYFILLNESKIQLMNRIDGCIKKSIDIYSGEFLFYNGLSFLTFDNNKKVLSCYDLNGKALEYQLNNVPNNSKLIDYHNTDLIFFNSKDYSLHF